MLNNADVNLNFLTGTGTFHINNCLSSIFELVGVTNDGIFQADHAVLRITAALLLNSESSLGFSPNDENLPRRIRFTPSRPLVHVEMLGPSPDDAAV